jgi:hypothetical protein
MRYPTRLPARWRAAKEGEAMKNMAKFIAVAGFVALAACGGANTPGENVAERADEMADSLDNQADVIEQRSDEVSNDVTEDAMENKAEALEDRADAIRDQGEKKGDAIDDAAGR